jgi:cutinase
MKLSSTIIFLLPFLAPVLSLPISEPIYSHDVNALLAKIALLCPFSGIVADVSDLLTAGENTLAWLFGTQTSQDGLSSGSSCAAVTVVWARGTTEPGNVGVLVGPPFFDALKARVGDGNVVVQGVAYPASVEGFLVGGDAGGAQNM